MLGLRRYVVAGLVLVIAGVCGSATAVELSPDGQGEVIILPVYAATEEVNTVLTINNTDRFHTKALRVRLRDRDGAELLAFNLYLASYDTWAAQITRVGEEVRLQFSDESCTVAMSGSQIVELPASTTLGSAHGFIEVIEMGSFAGTHTANTATYLRQCEQLREVWTGGEWSTDPVDGLHPPRGGIRASAWVINVEKGALYSIPSTALRGYSDVAQHTLPNDPHPDLSSGRDAGTEAGATEARVCGRNRCVIDHFATPLEAVEAALMVHELADDYTVAPSLGAQSELVITYPTRHFSPPASGPQVVDMRLIDRDYAFPAFICFPPALPPPNLTDFCDALGDPHAFAHARSLELISFGRRVSGDPASNAAISAILGIEHSLTLPPNFPVPVSGLVRIGFDTRSRGTLRSNSNRLLYGMPAIGVMLLEVTNANLQGEDGVQQRANYGTATAPARTSRMSGE